MAFIEDCPCMWEGNYRETEVNLIRILIDLGRRENHICLFLHFSRGHRNMALNKWYRVWDKVIFEMSLGNLCKNSIT